jgi:type IV secretory pathway protease TraF
VPQNCNQHHDRGDVDLGAEEAQRRRRRPRPAAIDGAAEAEAHLMNWDEPASLDGRYFGSISVRAIVGRADPLWTFEED